ncbi:Alpha-2-macroglobulin, partial [Clarias magur]
CSRPPTQRASGLTRTSENSGEVTRMISRLTDAVQCVTSQSDETSQLEHISPDKAYGRDTANYIQRTPHQPSKSKYLVNSNSATKSSATEQVTEEDTANHNFQETWQQPPKSRRLVKANSAPKSSATEQ